MGGGTPSPAVGPSVRWQPPPEAFPVHPGIFKGWLRGEGRSFGGSLAFADENKAAGSFQIPPWEAGVMGALCLHPPRPKPPNFSQYVHSGSICDHLVAGTTDPKKGLRRKLILSTRLQGARLTHFRCSRCNRTTDKLITNHAYLFIKQGLGDIQRGSTIFTSFNLLSVIKRNTAARLHNTASHPPFPGCRLTSSPGAASALTQGLVILLQPLRCSPATCDFGQVPSPALISVSSSVKWVHAPLAARVPERNEMGDGC